MFWFRVAILVSILTVSCWTGGITGAIIVMMSEGSEQQSIIKDPALNGTIACYVLILIFQFLLAALCGFGLILCFKTWRNRFQMDHKLRHWFIVWVGCWAACLLFCMSIAIYSIVKGKDPQGQMGYMYEMFQKYTVDQKFVSSFERYQKDHNCCGLYGPDDWLIVQLRASPGGAGNMFQSMDYGFQQNPSTGKCHVIPPIIPSGCGALILKQVNSKLGLYGGLIILEVIIGVIAACIAWYCFFYWLEKEVIVIPEDEISNVVIIEPESSTLVHEASRSQTSYRSSHPQHYGSGYIPGSNYTRTSLRSNYTRGSLGSTGSIVVMHTNDPMQYGPASTAAMSPNHHHHNLSTTAHPHHHSHLIEASHHSSVNHHHHNPLKPLSTQSRLSLAGPFDSGSRNVMFNRQTHPNLPPAMLTASQTTRYIGSSDHRTVPLRHNSYMHSFPAHSTTVYVPPVEHHHHHHHNHEDPDKPKPTTLDKQLNKLGGKVLAEMHVEHEEDKLQAEINPKKKKVHHPTIALVRKKPVEEEPPKPPGHHGQTGNLAEDIAEMSGKNATNMIEDVIIPVNPHRPKPPPPPEKPKKLGSINEIGAMNNIENLIGTKALTEKTEAVIKKKEEEEKLLVKPHFLPGTGPAAAPPKHREHEHHHDHHEHHGGSEFGHHGTVVGSGTLPHGTAHYLALGSHSASMGHERAHYLDPTLRHHQQEASHRRAHYLNPTVHDTSHDRAHYLNPAHHHSTTVHVILPPPHESGGHERTHYLNPTHHDIHGHERGHYIDPQHHHDAGSHGGAHYLNPHHETHGHHVEPPLHHETGAHERDHYLNPPPHHDVQGHERTHYLEPPHHDFQGHERTHYIEPPHHEFQGHYVEPPYHEPGGHERDHYLNPLHHDTQGHERTHFLNPQHHDTQGHERTHYLNPQHHDTQGHERTHYLNPQHHDTQGHERTHYLDPPHHNDLDRPHFQDPPLHVDPDRPHYQDPPRNIDHDRPHYQDPPRAHDNGPTGQDHERTHYLNPDRQDHDRGNYDNGRDQAHDQNRHNDNYNRRNPDDLLGFGHHENGRYLSGVRRDDRYLDPGNHVAARYLDPGYGNHERTRYLDPGSQRYSVYPEDRHNRDRDNGNFRRDNYIRGEHGRAAYLDQSRRVDERAREPSYRSRAYYDDSRAGPSRSRSPRSTSRPRNRDSDASNATVIYKNPRRLDDND